MQIRDNSDNIVTNSHTIANICVFRKEPFLCRIDFPENVVCEKLKKLRISKSPGPDLTAANILRNCAEALSVRITSSLEQKILSLLRQQPIFKKGNQFDARTTSV